MIEEEEILYIMPKKNGCEKRKIVICEDVDDLDEINEDISEYSNSIEEVDFTKNNIISTIPEYFFFNFKQLTKIELPENIKIIEKNAFDDCESLETIIFHGVEEIERESFFNCSNLKTIILSNNIKKIDKNAFHYDNEINKYPFLITCPLHFESYFKSFYPNAIFTFCDENNYILK